MRNKKGFTLVELLVVIGVIVLLMAMLLPALERVSRQAKAILCQSNLRQWGVYIWMYTEGNNDNFFDINASGGGYTRWCEPMRPYIEDDPDILLCPMAKTHQPRNSFPEWGGSKTTAWEYPPDLGSYGINNWIVNVESNPGLSEYSRFWGNCLAQGGDDIPIMMDCMFGGGSPDSDNGPPPQDDYHGSIEGSCAMSHFCTDRHDDYINVVFMDWSVRKVGLKGLWTLKWHREFNTANKWTKAGGVQPKDWPEWMRRFKDY